MKNIVLVMSDQHSARYLTSNKDMDNISPNLDKIAQNGLMVSNAYCNAPLCVPSRMSFLTGKLPSETLILDNNSTLNSDQVTIAHKMSLLGYETILVGRMHFKGLDQFHGFDKRYVGDITAQYWGQSRSELEPFYEGFKAKSSQEVVGVGQSPVFDFDKQVLEQAKSLINEKRDKPYFMIIGFYSPHFPYISKDLNNNFKSSISKDDIERLAYAEYSDMIQKSTVKKSQHIDKIYQEMVYNLDSYVKEIYDDFKSNNQDGLFIYTSDHGDQVGRRGIFGKKTLYEDSIKVPLIIEGLKLDASKNLSLIDLHNIILNYGENKAPGLKNNYIKVQQMIEKDQKPLWTEAIIKDNYKLISINNKNYLYDLQIDPEEETPLESAKAIKDELKLQLTPLSKQDVLKTHYQNQKLASEILIRHGRKNKVNINTKYQVESEFKLSKNLKFKKGR
ncbi:MAG: sulfatase-like hydrolase/transferase [Erysipelothrix sp.]|nr:sulfatase-like hydrolase/transferase [Erysipelothrix sp.]